MVCSAIANDKDSLLSVLLDAGHKLCQWQNICTKSELINIPGLSHCVLSMLVQQKKIFVISSQSVAALTFND